MKEIHIVIFQSSDLSRDKQIQEVVRNNLTILKVVELTCSGAYMRTLHAELFQQHFRNWAAPDNNEQLLCIVAEDNNPQYGDIITPKGFVKGNLRITEIEQNHAGLPETPYGLYATYNEREATLAALFLMGQNIRDLKDSCDTVWDGHIESLIRKDSDAKEWRNETELFYTIESLTDYVLIRRIEPSPEHATGRMDILLKSMGDSYDSLLKSTAKSGQFRRNYPVVINQQTWEVEFWENINSYIDSHWVDDIFRKRQKVRGYWEPDAENAFYLFIYYAALNCPKLTSSLAQQADVLWKSSKHESPIPFETYPARFDVYWLLLSEWMKTQGYRFVRPRDPSLPYNQRVLELTDICRHLENSTDFQSVAPILVNQYGGGGYTYFQGRDLSGKRYFIKWGGIGESAQAEYNATKKLYDLNPCHFPCPKSYYNQQGRRYFAMEYLEGKDLRTLINENSLTPEDKHNIAGQLETISATLFQAKMVHRDIRPENLYLLSDGLLKLIDCQWAVSLEEYDEISHIKNNPRMIYPLGTEYAVNRCIWDDHHSIGKVIDELIPANVFLDARESVKARMGKQVLHFFNPPNKDKVHSNMNPKAYYEFHRDWLGRHGTKEQVYRLNREWFIQTATPEKVYQIDRCWLQQHGTEEELHQLDKTWLEKKGDETALFQLNRAWLEKKDDEEALYKLNRSWLEKTADEKAVYLLDKTWLEKRGDEEALYKLNRSWLEKTADEKAVYLLDKAWLEKRGDEGALYKLNRSWLEKTADEKAVYLLDKAWLEKRGDEVSLYQLNRAWLEKTADEKAVYLLDKSWLEKRGDVEALYQLEKTWLGKHGTREEQYRHERQHLISIREDKQKLYQLDCEWFRSNKDCNSLHRLEKEWLIAHNASDDEIFELDCKWYQQTGKNDEWYNLKKSRLLRMGSLREIRTFENTHEVKRRSYLRIGKWLYLRRRRQWNARQVVLRIGRREWILSKVSSIQLV